MDKATDYAKAWLEAVLETGLPIERARVLAKGHAENALRCENWDKADAFYAIAEAR